MGAKASTSMDSSSSSEEGASGSGGGRGVGASSSKATSDAAAGVGVSKSSESSSKSASTTSSLLSKEEARSVKAFLEEAKEVAKTAAKASKNGGGDNVMKTLEKQLKTIDSYLQTRTYFATDRMQTEADVAMCKALYGVKDGVVEKYAEIKRFVELMTQTNDAGVLAPAVEEGDDDAAVEALGKRVEKMAVGGGEPGKISKGQAKKDAAKAAKKAANEPFKRAVLLYSGDDEFEELFQRHFTGKRLGNDV